MRREVEIGSIREPVQFFLAERIFEFEIDSALSVVRAVAFRHIELAHGAHADAHCFYPIVHAPPPHFKTLFPFLRSDEVFDFHLFEFARAEYEIARRYLVPECFAYLPQAEWEFRVDGIDEVLEIYEHAARRFWAQI